MHLCRSDPVCTALYKSKLPLAAREKMVSWEQLGSVRSFFLEYKTVISDVRGPESGERVPVAEKKGEKVEAPR